MLARRAGEAGTTTAEPCYKVLLPGPGLVGQPATRLPGYARNMQAPR